MKTLEIRLNQTSIGNAIKYFERYRNRLSKKIDELEWMLATEGAQVAQRIYGTAVTVTVRREKDGVSVLASGKAVAFLEFGAGMYTDSLHPLAGKADNEGLAVYDGSYSESHANQYTTLGYWFFNGMKIEGVQPRYAMWEADKAMSNEVVRIAKEVFKDE